MYLVQDAVGRELPLSYALSLLILGVCLLMALSAWLESAGRADSGGAVGVIAHGSLHPSPGRVWVKIAA